MSQSARLRSVVPLAAAVIVGAVAVSVLVGWWIDSRPLVKVHSALPPMPFNTALGLLAGALGLVCLARGRRALAGAVQVLGIFALLGHAGGLDAAYGWGRVMFKSTSDSSSMPRIGWAT